MSPVSRALFVIKGKGISSINQHIHSLPFRHLIVSMIHSIPPRFHLPYPYLSSTRQNQYHLPNPLPPLRFHPLTPGRAAERLLHFS